MLYTREADEVTLGSSLKRAGVSTSFNKKIPYLSFLYMNYDIEAVNDAADWICDSTYLDYNTCYTEEVLENLINEENKDIAVRFLNAAGIPIEGLRIEESEDHNHRRIWLTHSVEGKAYELLLSKESAGTRKLLSLAVLLSSTLKRGSLMAADELDAKLHPKLLRFVVKLFTDPESNPNGAQLVFTCQDVTIMRNDVFRRDEIWFAERDADQASSLWSLSDMREPNGNPVNKNAAFDKQYLAGRYGADPILDASLIEW